MGVLGLLRQIRNLDRCLGHLEAPDYTRRGESGVATATERRKDTGAEGGGGRVFVLFISTVSLLHNLIQVIY